MEEYVVKTRMHKINVVLPADVRVQKRSPGNGQRVHAILVLELVGHQAAVLAAACRHNTVVAPVLGTVLV